MTLPGGRPGGDKRGNNEQRKRRKDRLLRTWAADSSFVTLLDPEGELYYRGELTAAEIKQYEGIYVANGFQMEVEMACRCFRCGKLLTFATMTVDRIVPGCIKTRLFPRGGTYVDHNIRPACSGCNTETGLVLAQEQRAKKSASKTRRPAASTRKPAKGGAAAA